jgi:ABC-2 type transport system permease protein
MSANLIGKEIRRNRNRFIMWLAIIEGFMAFSLAMLPTMLGSSTLVTTYLGMFPKQMLSAFGMDLSSWGSLLGMYSTYHVFYAMVFGGIFAVSLGGDILAKEENGKTADFLLTRPLSRNRIVASKLVVLVLYVTLLCVCITATGWIGLAVSSKEPWSVMAFLALNLQSWLLCLLFAGLGLLISVLGNRSRPSTGIGTGVVLGAYFLDALARAFEKAKDAGWASPFRFVDTVVTAPGYHLEWWRLLYLAGLPVLFCVLTFVRYRRKDILA